MPSPRTGDRPAVDVIKYVYILATTYSGSTLLSLLLDSHPRVVSIGELDNTIHKYPGYKCSCGRAIVDCGFWKGIRELCTREGVELDLQNFRVQLRGGLGRRAEQLIFGAAPQLKWLVWARDLLLRQLPPYEQHVRQIFDRNSAIARSVIEFSGKDLFVDASKTVARVPHLLRRRDIDLRIIHIVRDPRAVAWSAEKRKRPVAGEVGRYWLRTHSRALQLAPLLGRDRYFRFRWEDFCGAPKPTLDQICSFLAVEPVDLVSCVNAKTHHIIGNRVRSSSVASIDTNEEWRGFLSPSLRGAVERSTAPLGASFGYI
jgi:hypothetical protein